MDYYRSNASRLVREYRALDPEALHIDWTNYLPAIPGTALDIGAGSGRDAYWLASLGWRVTAVEPCDELRELAQTSGRPKSDAPGKVAWLKDSLPALVGLSNAEYQLILVSAVWMHLSPPEQSQAYKRITDLLAPGGLLVVSWRNVAGEPGRGFHTVEEDLFNNWTIVTSADQQGREGVIWKTAVITADAL